MKIEKTSPKHRILETAVRLFNSIGVHTVGIDRIIEESGVAKKTFYRHYPSKNKLIGEYFRKRDEVWFGILKKYTSTSVKDPMDRVLGIFDGLKFWFSQPDFFGCSFIRGLSDFGEEKNDPELAKCLEDHFTRTDEYVAGLLKEVRPKDYRKFVPQMASLIAGATIVAHGTGNPKIADINKEMARTLLLKS